MSARFTAAATLALTLIGTSVASAFPIVNQVRTEAPTLAGQLSGNVTYRINGSETTRGGILAKQFLTTTTIGGSNQGGSIPYDQFTPGRVYKTYCIEITENLNQNAITTVIDRIPPGTANPQQEPWDSVTPSAATLQRAAWIIRFGEQKLASNLSAATKQAAIQLAIWEVVYEAGTSEVGNVSSMGAGPNGFKVNSGYNTAATAGANLLLEKSFGKQFGGLAFFQNVTLNSSGTETVRIGSGQNVLAAVPEPSTLAIAGLSTLALLGYGVRRRKSARD